MSGVFVTGTDTEIGKTFVSQILIKILVNEGLQVSGMKPVASGATMQEGQLKNEDAVSLIDVANVKADYQTINPYVFEAAISPHLAAAQANIEIDFSQITNAFNELNNRSDAVIVEGVGGWYAPLTRQCTVADLARELDLPVILVVGLRLGCLSHALLTLQAIKQSGLTVMGWVANQVTEDFKAIDENIDTLKSYFNDIPLIASVPYNISCDANVTPEQLNKQLLINRLTRK